jgi:FkbM family methyltransferase
LRGRKWITGSATHGCWLGTYERETQQVFTRLVREGDVVYDIGANVGFFTLLAARVVGRRGAVYAFEPLPHNLQYLRAHIAANGAAVHVLPVALSSSSGVARFATATSAAMGYLADGGDLEVRTETVDELVSSGRILPPRFMKVDVEGAEHEVLAGASATLTRARPIILLSTHGYQVHEQCCAFLRELRYEIEVIRDGTADGQYTLVATPARLS